MNAIGLNFLRIPKIDIMGVALMAWRTTIDFDETVVRKARAGCKIRILLMHPENPMLPGMTIDMEVQKQNIIHNFAHFKSLASESGNIEVRQISRGIPYFFLTRSDQCAVINSVPLFTDVGVWPFLAM
jgi:hypothetical protein